MPKGKKSYYSPEPVKTTPITVGKRTVAHVVGESLNKTIDGERHMLKRPPAIAFDEAVIEQAVQLSAKKIHVVDMRNRKNYDCTMDTFMEYCKVFDRGYGKQLYLVLAYWGIDGKPSPHDAKLERERLEREAEEERRKMQLPLFDLEAA